MENNIEETRKFITTNSQLVQDVVLLMENAILTKEKARKILKIEDKQKEE